MVMFRLRPRLSNSTNSDLIPEDVQSSIKDYKRMEQSMQAILKTCKSYLAAIEAMNKARIRLRENLNDIPLFKLSTDLSDISRQDDDIEKLKRVAEGIVFLGTHKLSDHVKKTVHDPLKKFIKIFPGVNESIRHYEKLAAEFERARDKYNKLSASSSFDPNKIDKV